MVDGNETPLNHPIMGANGLTILLDVVSIITAFQTGNVTALIAAGKKLLLDLGIKTLEQ